MNIKLVKTAIEHVDPYREGFKLQVEGRTEWWEIWIERDADGVWWTCNTSSNRDGEFVERASQLRRGDERSARGWLKNTLEEVSREVAFYNSMQGVAEVFARYFL